MVYVRGAGGPVHRGRRRRTPAGRRARRGRRRGSPRTPRPGRPPGIRAAATPPGRCWTPGPCSSPSGLSSFVYLVAAAAAAAAVAAAGVWADAVVAPKRERERRRGSVLCSVSFGRFVVSCPCVLQTGWKFEVIGIAADLSLVSFSALFIQSYAGCITYASKY
jgi:hypothetical protein